MDFIDIVQLSLFLPQAVPFQASLGDNQQVCRPGAYLVFQSPCFQDPDHIPSGSGLGVFNKAIILRKMWKIIINSFLIYAVFLDSISVEFIKAGKVHY